MRHHFLRKRSSMPRVPILILLVLGLAALALCQCPGNCAICDADNGVCELCEKGFVRNDVGSCDSNCEGPCNLCDGGEYEDMSGACVPCQNKCATCDNGDSCLTCGPGFGRDQPTDDCERCSSGCKSCSSSTICTSCHEGFNLENNACIRCASGCLTCTGTEVADCTSCKDGRYASPALGGACVYSCPDEEYENGNVCEPCNEACESCFGGAVTECTQCQAVVGTETVQYYLDGTTCVADCTTSATYASDIGFVCSPCPHACTSCSSATVCTDCETGLFSSGNDCVVNCGDNEFEDGMQCTACSGDCERCTSAEDCLSCTATSGKFYDSETNRCVETCTGATYGNTDTMTCSACNARCDACTGPLRDCTASPDVE